MEEVKTSEKQGTYQDAEDKNLFTLQYFYTTFILNFKWFIVSLVICLGCAALYLRYTTPTYSVVTNLLVKDDQQQRRGASNAMLANMSDLGFLNNSSGFDNEIELLKSHSLSEAAIRDLKLYVSYYKKGNVKSQIIYKTQPINADMDAVNLDTLETPIEIEIEKRASKYDLAVTYHPNQKSKETVEIVKQGVTFPTSINTKLGRISLYGNGKYTNSMKDGDVAKVVIVSPKMMGVKYVKNTTIAAASKTTTIANISLVDEVPQRGIDYLNQLAVVYNRQANEDKNEIAFRTDKFINERLKKIDKELGTTDGNIEDFKRSNGILDVAANAAQSMTQTTQYDQKLSEAQAQLMLLNSLNEYMNHSGNKYQPIPSNVGLNDDASTSFINEFNKTVLERNRLLRTASEKSPNVQALTAQLDELATSIRQAMLQAKRNQTIIVNSINNQYHKYNGQINQTPKQERILTQIGREQEVKSALYIMLLQKREENSISLASTANKGKLIDAPDLEGKVAPKTSMILLIALVLAFLIPFGIFILIEMMRYRIGGHEDVQKLTKLPIIADVAVANESAKAKADIVVHENKNNHMEEIFRAMRTNLQFTMKEGDKVIMFTSSTSGEGKTFCAANLAVSFALLGKKVVLVGLDIRRPRLNSLFEINDKVHGITNLLVRQNVEWSDIQEQIVPSDVHKNLELLMAGPIPPNPAELVARKTLEDVFALLRANYDIIIVDTAPVGIVTDTFAIGRVCDATIITTRADYTEKAAFNMINDLAHDKKLPNMSLIINGIDMSKKKYGYAYGYGKYGKYGRYGSYGYKNSYGYGSSYGYGNYSNSHYGNANDTSVKTK